MSKFYYNKPLLEVVSLTNNKLTLELIESLKIDNLNLDKEFEKGYLYTIISNQSHDNTVAIRLSNGFSVLKIIIIYSSKNKYYYVNPHINKNIIKEVLSLHFNEKYSCGDILDNFHEYNRIIKIYENL